MANDHADRRGRARGRRPRPCTAGSSRGSSSAASSGSSRAGVHDRPRLADPAVPARPRPVLHRPAGRRPGPVDGRSSSSAACSRASAPARSRRSPTSRSGGRCRRAPRPRMFATLSTAWVLPGLLGPVHRRRRRRGAPLAAGLPRPAAADRGRGSRWPARRSRAIGPATGRRGASTTSPSTRAAACRWRVILTLGAAMTVAGLTDASLVAGLALVVVGLGIALPAFRRLTPPGTLRAARGPAGGRDAARRPDVRLLLPPTPTSPSRSRTGGARPRSRPGSR